MYKIEEILIPVFIMATLLTVIFIFFVFATLVRLKSKKNKKEHDSLKAINEERERTMQAISIEIHNNVNQTLGLALLTLNMLNKTDEDKRKKYIKDITTMLKEAIGDLRAISHSLNASNLKKLGMLVALEKECKRLNNAGKLVSNLEADGELRPMEADTELILIRIAQEAIQNVLKHSSAKNLEIMLDYKQNVFTMSIKDDGKGFTVNPEAKWSGMGLQSIQNQSRIIEGCNLELQSSPGFGTTLSLTILHPPYKKYK